MELKSVKDIESQKDLNVEMKTIFDQNTVHGGRTRMGTVSIPPGERVPLQGTGSHKENEYSLVLKGSMLTESGGNKHRVSKGEATFIQAGEQHWAYNDGGENCEIVWVLVRE